MPKKVWLVRLNGKEDLDTARLKLSALLVRSRILDVVGKDDFSGIKLHFGEKNNTGHINPNFVREIVGHVSKRTKNAFLTDTNVLYKNSQRANSVDHLKIASLHGFSLEKMGVPVIISDGIFGKDYAEIEISKKHFKKVKIARDIASCDSIVVLTHVTGHMYTGLGGAIKNLGMGCASRRGKYEQHSQAIPDVEVKFCTGCGRCASNCPGPAGTIVMKDGVAAINASLCLGCGECVVVCRTKAIGIKWSEKLENLQQKMVEYAYGAIKAVNGKAIYISFLMKVTKNCDCIAEDEDRVTEDLGILASFDPVAIDKAAADMINTASGCDLLNEVNPDTKWRCQVDYAAAIGLGDINYELIEINKGE
jgi:uncharacterized Fe-S center protein